MMAGQRMIVRLRVWLIVRAPASPRSAAALGTVVLAELPKHNMLVLFTFR
jgi:hypothetical protein